MIINRGKIARDKLELLQNGQTVFADSPEIIERLRKYITEYQLDVVEDVTDRGTWFIPQDDDTK
ncbi:hypothetical protein EVJ27_02210 [Exiguobacterium sp. SH3S2]|uniref:hypothetical protein n=1 Tax=Exiguobacterium TaxID=33986 RepID=UPI0003529487|nr:MULTISPECIES: hypothetical protein [Exiguobacterium]EPE62889.1 hypothetical protein L479_00693 [Exiguobacterium sp. S17]OGX80155.1 hypothetical protein A6395_03105 [Exiguobacterium sp. SH31]TCI39495.1 hypothetical protein EVJ29_02315 [Exiguobacterium sp. SH4S7]TCI47810.1 hypothetical protein EVJ31_01890 [Exiguobacterium sp. SH5S32]TCI48801.1 hypothetical protein EVJ28_02205 [Exiguobacterium sp. SH3S3]